MRRNSQDMKLSRIGREPVRWPSNVKVCVSDCTVFVEGPMGKVSRRLPQLGSLQVRFFDPEGQETIYTNNASSLTLEIPKPSAAVETIIPVFAYNALIPRIDASKYLGEKVKKAVITVSAYFNELLEYPSVLGYKFQFDKLLNYSEYKSLIGSYRTTISNLVVGVTAGFCKKLRLVGVGYKAEVHENVDEKIGKKGEQGVYCGGKKTILHSHLINNFNSSRSEYQKCLLKAVAKISDPYHTFWFTTYSLSDHTYFWGLYELLFTEAFFNRLRDLCKEITTLVPPGLLSSRTEVPASILGPRPFQEKKILEKIIEEIKSIGATTYRRREYCSTIHQGQYLTSTHVSTLVFMICEVFELSKDFYDCIITSDEPSLLEKPEEVKKTILLLRVGYSHPVGLIVPQGLEAKVDGSTIIISGVSKEKVTSFAAKVRCVRPPEPYKGKGILYEGEFVRRKAGKTAKSGKSGK